MHNPFRLIMLIFLTFQSKSHMSLSQSLSTIDPIEACFYEKRLDTSLHGYNDVVHLWTSELECFDRCLRSDHPPCRSFEYWRSNYSGLCVRANISLADEPSFIGRNTFVDYYEVDCRTTLQEVIIPDVIECTKNHVTVTVRLNGISGNHVFLGDQNCTATALNTSHVQFRSILDQCSLNVNNGSVVGKLRWQLHDQLVNRTKRYERFFRCPLHSGYISRVPSSRTTLTTTTTLSTATSHVTDRRLPESSSVDDQHVSTPYEIAFQWTLHDRSFICPEACYVSLYSFLNVTLDDLSAISTRFFIDSCDLKALFPYTVYVQSRRLIHQGCSMDPATIHLSQSSPSLSQFSFSFYLYHILKEPIPFQIQCKLIDQERSAVLPRQSIDCSMASVIDSSMHQKSPPMYRSMKRNDIYTVFRSSPVYVTRKLPSISPKEEIFHHPNTFSSTASIHSSSLVLVLFCLQLLLDPHCQRKFQQF